jgi:hypothetical protein
VARRGADSLFVLFVKWLRKKPNAVDMTIVAGGVLVSGTAISAREYHERLGELMDNATWSGIDKSETTEPSGLLRDYFYKEGAEAEQELEEMQQKSDELGDRLDERAKAGPLSEEERREFIREFERLEPRYFHMRDVEVFGGGLRPVSFPLWRTRIDAVTSWTVGRVSPAADRFETEGQ